MATITRYSCSVCGAWYDTQAKATACATRNNAAITNMPASLTLKVYGTNVVYNKAT